MWSLRGPIEEKRTAAQPRDLRQDAVGCGWLLRTASIDQSGTVTLYHYLKELGMSVTASEARKQLFPLIEKVNNDRVAVEITSRRGNAVLVSADEYAALEETAYLLRVPANAKRLLESLQQAKSGDRHEHELAE